jgi:serine/threonine-protein kinase HipA
MAVVVIIIDDDIATPANIPCNNTDDHLRNHGFLWDGKGWRLSPAYDIVPYPQVSLERDLAIGVGRNGRQATLKNALSDAASFGLSLPQAIGLALDIQKKVKENWEGVFKDSGIVGVELERLRTCFIACDETIQQPDADTA